MRMLPPFLASWLVLPVALTAGGQEDSSRFTVIARTGERFRSVSAPVIGSTGEIAFSVRLAGGGGGVFLGDGRAVTAIAEEGGRFRSIGNPEAVNRAGTVVFSAYLPSGEPGVFAGYGGPFVASLATAIHGAYAGAGGPVVTIAVAGGPFHGFDNDLAIDDRGRVLFTAIRTSDGGHGLFTGDGGPIRPKSRS